MFHSIAFTTSMPRCKISICLIFLTYSFVKSIILRGRYLLVWLSERSFFCLIFFLGGFSIVLFWPQSAAIFSVKKKKVHSSHCSLVIEALPPNFYCIKNKLCEQIHIYWVITILCWLIIIMAIFGNEISFDYLMACGCRTTSL